MKPRCQHPLRGKEEDSQTCSAPRASSPRWRSARAPRRLHPRRFLLGPAAAHGRFSSNFLGFFRENQPGRERGRRRGSRFGRQNAPQRLERRERRCPRCLGTGVTDVTSPRASSQLRFPPPRAPGGAGPAASRDSRLLGTRARERAGGRRTRGPRRRSSPRAESFGD